jgi:hypothetical protein
MVFVIDQSFLVPLGSAALRHSPILKGLLGRIATASEIDAVVAARPRDELDDCGGLWWWTAEHVPHPIRPTTLALYGFQRGMATAYVQLLIYRLPHPIAAGLRLHPQST